MALISVHASISTNAGVTGSLIAPARPVCADRRSTPAMTGRAHHSVANGLVRLERHALPDRAGAEVSGALLVGVLASQATKDLDDLRPPRLRVVSGNMCPIASSEA